LFIICGVHAEFSIKIGLFDLQRLFFSPFFNTHFLNQAKIEQLRVVLPDSSLVRIGMKMITGKFSALEAKGDTFLFCAAEDNAWTFVTQKFDGAFRVSAPFARCLSRGQAQSFGDVSPEVQVLICQICGTIETIQPAWRSHYSIIHDIWLLLF